MLDNKPWPCSGLRPTPRRLCQWLRGIACSPGGPFHPLQFPLVNNWQARLVTDPNEARLGLIEQIPNPVQWTESVRELNRCGIKRFIEVGPGAVLVGLCRNILPELRGSKFGEASDVEALNSNTLR